MKTLFSAFILLFISTQFIVSQQHEADSPLKTYTKTEQEIITLSGDKWQWMADKNTEALSNIILPNFHTSGKI